MRFTRCLKSKHLEGSFIVTNARGCGQVNPEYPGIPFRFPKNYETLVRGSSTMLPNFLIPETVIREAGTGPEMSVGSTERGLLLLTLGITRIIEQQSLDIALYGSADNVEWSAKPLISFSQKFYCGTYQLLLDLSSHPE